MYIISGWLKSPVSIRLLRRQYGRGRLGGPGGLPRSGVDAEGETWEANWCGDTWGY
jgi:hypothetical protein